jgi:hypothetical protein
VPKFELYKHNDEFFSIYYGIFYELWTFRKISNKNPEHMLNYSLPCSCSWNLSSFWVILKQQWTIEEISIFSNSSYLEWRAGVSAVLYPRWLPLLKIEISSNGKNCSILSQNVPKFELYKHNDEFFSIYYGIFYIKICLICIIGINRLKEKFQKTPPNIC